MAIEILSLKRVFKVGSLELDDPTPNGTLDESVKALSMQFPQFRQSRLYEEDGVPDPSTGKIVFTLILPPPKKNG